MNDDRTRRKATVRTTYLRSLRRSVKPWAPTLRQLVGGMLLALFSHLLTTCTRPDAARGVAPVDQVTSRSAPR
jgi:hypothetical protein